MKFRFTYDTYQDVRHNLFKYSTPVLVSAGFFAYWLILPPTHRTAIDNLFAIVLVQSSWLKGISGITLFALLAFLLTEILQVHDRWYDRYIIKWRFRYATDFILPRLIHPFATNINRRFHEVAEQNVEQFQERLYYPYVGDRETKIGKNKLVRFYEVVTLYWLTQINEIVLFILFTLLAVYWLLVPSEPTYAATLLDATLILVGIFLLNRMWIRQAKEKVRRATNDEIEDILTNHLDDLRVRVQRLCADYNIEFKDES